uniref:Uncharacterized protein n=1 Tax=Lotharella oceanica TaxID=641309 RepID=A0A7S2X948_9EUKA|mmetsp:Transcript_19504/g.36710  ORF Transcript_19504/g.36710 Transcript_19504/m.36710 type:complete len:570 (+) Transcript_19504:72-1781(+)
MDDFFPTDPPRTRTAGIEGDFDEFDRRWEDDDLPLGGTKNFGTNGGVGIRTLDGDWGSPIPDNGLDRGLRFRDDFINLNSMGDDFPGEYNKDFIRRGGPGPAVPAARRAALVEKGPDDAPPMKSLNSVKPGGLRATPKYDLVTERMDKFHAWFSVVKNWLRASVLFWHMTIVLAIVSLSLVHLQGVWGAALSVLSPLASLSIGKSLLAILKLFVWPMRKFGWLGPFVLSQWLVVLCHIWHFTLQRKPVTKFDSLFLWLFSTRTWMFLPGITASASAGAWTYLQLAGAIHGDYMAPSANSERVDLTVVWSGILVLALFYAFHVIFIQDRVAQFPSLQRKGLGKMKTIVPKCMARAASTSIMFTALWCSSCVFLGPRTMIRGFSSWLEFATYFAAPGFDMDASSSMTSHEIGGWGPVYTLFVVGFVLLASWELARELTWSILTMRINFSTEDLLVAINVEKDVLGQHLGMCYLETISSHLPRQRKSLFALDRRRRVSQWQFVSKAIVKILKKMAGDLHELSTPLPVRSYWDFLFNISVIESAEAVSQDVQLCVFASQRIVMEKRSEHSRPC